MNRLVDSHGRRLRKLRVSLTESCNLRCFHCMKEDLPVAPPFAWLPPDELEGIVARLAALGIDQVRLTGGEPTLRPELREIVARLGRLPLRRLGITSNGVLLAPLLPELQAAGLGNLNLSLDSLDAATFARISGSPDHALVLRTLDQAIALGLETKLNVVLFRGLNDHEAPALVRFAEERGVAVRFLELMRIGPDQATNRRYFVSAAETLSLLRREGFRLRRRRAPADATALEYRTADGGRLGFIASETRPFCAACSRLRLSAAGVLRACLMREEGICLRGLADGDWPAVLRQVLAWKPQSRPSHIGQPMVRIGG
ncbi:MAG: radical SAM protein [bacterium]|jgi:cyclic pyranopterin phosphate synthase|nr:radical SAM protein [bacterium]